MNAPLQTHTMHMDHPHAPDACFNAVLVSNFGGTTGALLGLDGGNLAAQLRLDVLYPVRGFKRCLDARNGFGAQCRTETPLSSCKLHEQMQNWIACCWNMHQARDRTPE